MFIQVLFFLVMIIGLTSMMVVQSFATVHTVRDRMMRDRLEHAAASGVEDLRVRVAAHVAATTLPNASYIPLRLPAEQIMIAPGILERITAESQAFTYETASTGKSQCASDATTRICNAERSGALGEERLEATLDLSYRDGSTVAANLRRRVKFRTFRHAPYALVASITDSDIDGKRELGDGGGIAPEMNDLQSPDPAVPQRYRDTRIRVYAPCRQVPSGATVEPNEGKGWQDWQGDQPGPAHEEICDTGAGETSTYIDEHQQTFESPHALWEH